MEVSELAYSDLKLSLKEGLYSTVKHSHQFEELELFSQYMELVDSGPRSTLEKDKALLF